MIPLISYVIIRHQWVILHLNNSGSSTGAIADRLGGVGVGVGVGGGWWFWW